MIVLKRWHVLTALFVLVVLIFGHTLAGGFVFDDRNIIEHAALFADLGNVGHAFMAPFWTVDIGLYRPVVMLSFSLNAVLGMWPELFHLGNILLYIFVCYLVYSFVRRWSSNEVMGSMAALLFLVLPIHTEVVANISNRNELLAALFSLLALREAGRENIRYWLLGLWVFLALGSKESAVAVVPLVLLVLYLREKNIVEILQKHFRALSATVLGAGFYFFLRFFILGPAQYLTSHTSLIENPLQYTDWYPRVLTAFSVFWMYVQKTVWPAGLCSDYSYNQIPVVHTLSTPETLLGIALFGTLSILALYLLKKIPLLSIAFAMLILSFLPVSNILFPMGTIAGERLFFLPSLGLCILAAYLAWSLYEYIRTKFSPGNKTVPIVAVLFFVCTLIGYGAVSFEHQKVWLSEKALFLSAAACAPESVLSRSNAGAMYYLDGDLVNAKRELEYAMSIKPIYSKGINNLGLVYNALGDKKKAEQLYLLAAAQDFPYSGAYENLVQLYLSQGRYADARRWLNVLHPNQAAAVEDLIQQARDRVESGI